MSDISIVVIGYDKYKSIWEDFYNKYISINSNSQIPIFLVNSTENFDKPNIIVMNAGIDSEWSDKVRYAISKIESKYILLLLEDFFITNTINKVQLDDLTELMDEKNLKFIKIASINPYIKLQRMKKFDKEKKHLKIMSPKRGYSLGLQPTIWEKQFLSDVIGASSYNAWIFEMYYSSIDIKEKSQLMSLGLYDTRNILGIKHILVQGKILRPSFKYFIKINDPLKIDFDVMKRNESFAYGLKSFFVAITPYFLRPLVKFLGSFVGFKYTSSKYYNNIDEFNRKKQ